MNRDQAKFCEECGHALQAVTPSVSESSSEQKNMKKGAPTVVTSNHDQPIFERKNTFDRVEMLELEDDVPQLDPKKLRSQEEASKLTQEKAKQKEEVIAEIQDLDAKKGLFQWFQPKSTPKLKQEQEKQKEKDLQEKEVPQVLDVEVHEEKFVEKFQRPSQEKATQATKTTLQDVIEEAHDVLQDKEEQVSNEQDEVVAEAISKKPHEIEKEDQKVQKQEQSLQEDATLSEQEQQAPMIIEKQAYDLEDAPEVVSKEQERILPKTVTIESEKLEKKSTSSEVSDEDVGLEQEQQAQSQEPLQETIQEQSTSTDDQQIQQDPLVEQLVEDAEVLLPPEKEKNRKKQWLLTAAILVILGGVGYASGTRYYAPQAQIDRFLTVLDSKDPLQISQQLIVEDQAMKVTSENIQPFVSLLDEDETYIEELSQFLEQAKPNEPSDQMDIYYQLGPKKFFLFPTYQWVMRPLSVTVETNKEQAQIMLNDQEITVADKTPFEATITPLLPGKYELYATWTQDKETLKNEYPYPLTRTVAQDFSKVNLALIPVSFNVESNVLTADIYVDDEKVGALEQGKAHVGPISWREDMELVLKKQVGSDLVDSTKVMIPEQPEANYRLTFADLITNEVTDAFLTELYQKVEAAVNEDKDLSEVAALFVDGEKNASYQKIKNMIERLKNDETLASVSFTPSLTSVTSTKKSLAKLEYHVDVVKTFKADSARDEERIEQKYTGVVQGKGSGEQFHLKLKQLSAPKTSVDKVEVPPTVAVPPSESYDTENSSTVVSEQTTTSESTPVAPSPVDSTVDTYTPTDQTSELPLASEDTSGGPIIASPSPGVVVSGDYGLEDPYVRTDLSQVLPRPNRPVDNTQWQPVSRPSEIQWMLQNMYGVLQSVGQTPVGVAQDPERESELASYFVGGSQNKAYDEVLAQIEAYHQEPGYTQMTMDMQMIKVSAYSGGRYQVTYEITYYVVYTTPDGKSSTKTETYRYPEAQVVWDQGYWRIDSLGSAVKK